MSYLIVGLGNIGIEYADTRHNVGFTVLDALARASNISFTTMRYGALTEYRFKGRTFMLLKPSTYMNLSGKAVNYWLKAENIPLENLLVIVDDLALPYGTLRLRKQGSDGGHNGLKDINLALGTQNYARLRIGIGSNFAKGDQIDYVLSGWEDDELKQMPEICEKAADIIRAFGLSGVDFAMNNFNSRK
jgi:PTH1 family peptidyl-tRNA hydrolase